MSQIKFDINKYNINYDESKVPAYKLPEVLVGMKGDKIESAKQWRNERRPEIIKLFQDNVYGEIPSAPKGIFFKEVSEKYILDGKGRQKQIKLWFDQGREDICLNLLVYFPVKCEKPVPVFANMNFRGNYTISFDDEIMFPEGYVREYKEKEKPELFLESARGSRADKYPLQQIIESGFGLVTACYEDIMPDDYEWYEKSLERLQTVIDNPVPYKEKTSAISIWAWCLIRIMDFIEKYEVFDNSKVCVIGHSRLGKTSIWAGVNDERFSIVVSNDSGCGGAAITRRCYGETLEAINTQFPHWFCKKFKDYVNKEDQLPLDQHMLLSLVAPRPLYVASAEDDLWADPKGEFLSAFHSGKVYELYGIKGLKDAQMPQVNSPKNDTYVAYHIRNGGHAINEYDWRNYIDFCQRHMSNMLTNMP